jgi:hypothetical protein
MTSANAIDYCQQDSQALFKTCGVGCDKSSFNLSAQSLSTSMCNDHDQALRLLVWGSQRVFSERERCFGLFESHISNFSQYPSKVKVTSDLPAHIRSDRASSKIVLPAILPERIKPTLCFVILRGQKRNLAVRSLNRARLATTARGRNPLIHS